MHIRIFRNKSIASDFIANLIVDKINSEKEFNLGLATGSTYLETYKNLVDAYKKNNVSFEKVKTFNLDEYLDIDRNHPQTYYHFMRTHLFNDIDIERKNIFFPPVDTHVYFHSFDDIIKRNKGIDLQLLGIGNNGHIGFNEPGTIFNSKTHLIQLDQSTREQNKRFFNDNIDAVPHYAVTMGIQTIMQAKEIIITAFGEKKAEIVNNMIYGRVSEMIPATILQNHSNVTVVLDLEAASVILRKRGWQDENNFYKLQNSY